MNPRGALLVAIALAAPLACGKVGPPRLPQLAVPRAPEPVVVRNIPDGFEITIPRPREYLDGVPLDDLGNFEVSRSCEPGSIEVPVANVPIVDDDRFQKQKEISLTDFDPRPGQTCVYQVIAVTRDGYRSAPGLSAPVRRESPAITETPSTPPRTP